MAWSPNENKIISLLREFPGLDDDELSRQTGVRPRQQVNQICRRLESAGLIRREIGRRGKLVNVLVKERGDAQPLITDRAASHVRTVMAPGKSDPCDAQAPSLSDRVNPQNRGVLSPALPVRRNKQVHELESLPSEAFRWSPQDTLVLISCSGSKAHGGEPGRTRSNLIEQLSQALGEKLRAARAAVSEQARIDERRLRPAWQRYAGFLYESSRTELARVMRTGAPAHVMILRRYHQKVWK